MKRAHIIGVGGIAMSAIAQYLASRGYQVSGSDLNSNGITEELKEKGIEITIGHSKANVGPGVELVIYSAAIPDNNIELVTAKERNLKILTRSEALAWITKDKFVVSVAGTHGKTTTSGMVAQVLTAGGKDPNFIIGGILNNFNSNYAITEQDLFVLEGDEYNRSFLKYQTDIGILTNVEFDHPDIYEDFADLKETYKKYISDLEEVLITNFAVIEELDLEESKLDVELVTVGVEDDQANFNAVAIREEGFISYFNLEKEGKDLGEFKIAALGNYNIKHAVEAIAVASYFEISIAKMKSALAGWSGVKRRFELLAHNEKRVIISDYAHHPSALKVVADDLDRIKTDKKKILIFQPHQYIRTERLLSDYQALLSYQFDKVIIQKIYSVREDVSEQEIEQLGQKLTEIIGVKAEYYADFEQLEEFLTEYNKNNSAVYLFMGAGNIDDFARQWVAKLK